MSSYSYAANQGGYDWASLLISPFVAAVLIGIIFTATMEKSGWVRAAAIITAIIITGVFIFAISPSAIAPPDPATVSPAVADSYDPFIYEPGATSTGVVIFSGNASAYGSQYNCGIKSGNTTWNSRAGNCQCKTGFYGPMCNYEGFSSDYVSLTTDTIFTTGGASSSPAPSLSTWPTEQTSQGCTNTCTAANSCLGVTYANGVCTQFTTINFPQAPIQNTTLNPPVLPTTLYLNLLRLQRVNMSGYFNAIFGTLPVRYFVGNGLSSASGGSVHVTSSGTRINYYVIGVNATLGGIPDYIMVNTAGILNLSTTPIPPAASIVPGSGSVVQFTTPIALPKSRFPFSVASQSYFVRLDPA